MTIIGHARQCDEKCVMGSWSSNILYFQEVDKLFIFLFYFYFFINDSPTLLSVLISDSSINSFAAFYVKRILF
jgi:hypothetical protein